MQITVIFYHLKVHIRKVQPVESVGLRLKKTINLYHVYHGVSLSTGINHVINEAKSFQTTVVNYQLRWIWQRHSSQEMKSLFHKTLLRVKDENDNNKI